MTFRNMHEPRPRRSLPLILLPMLLCGAAALLLGQDASWDLRNYHLYNPYALLQDRHALDLMPAGAQSFFNPLLDLGYFLVATRWDPRAAAFLTGLLQGSGFILVYGIARRTLPVAPPLHFLAALLGLLSVGFLAELGTSLQDGVVALFPLGALLLLLRGLDGERMTPRLPDAFAAGLLAGIGCGLKPVIATNALALCLALLPLAGPFAARLRAAFLFGVAVLLGIALSDGWWLLRVWELHGNPLFPQFNDLFQGALATAETHKDERFLPGSVVDKLLWPFLMSLEPYRAGEFLFEQWSWPLAYCLLLALGAQRVWLLARGRLPRFTLAPAQRLVLGYFCFAWLLWLQLFGIYRYLVPLELLLPTVFLLAALALLRAELARAAALAALLGVSAHNLAGVPDLGRAPWHGEPYRVERPEDLEQVSAVVLMGQPLAWLVPALDMRLPFIQGLPNFNTTQAYWRRALRLARGGSGLRVIFDPAAIDAETVARRLAWFDFRLQSAECRPLRAWLGAAEFSYRYCPIKE